MMRLLLVSLVLVLASSAAPAGSLEALLQQVREELKQERADGKARIERFRQKRDQQSQLLAQAKTALEVERARSQELTATRDENHARIGELKTKLDRQLGELSEVFGSVRQVSRESAESLASSMTASRLPEQVTLLRDLSERRELPDIEKLEGMWLALLDGMAASGRVERFSAPVIDPEGTEQQRHITRIGPFSAVSDGRFLRWLPQSGRFMEPARQPPLRLQEQARTLEQADSGWVNAPVDPSRGALLAVLVQSPSFVERIRQGGPIGYVILGLGAFGLLLVLERWAVLVWTGGRVRRQLKSEQASKKNPLGRILLSVDDWRHLTAEALQHKLDDAVLRELPKLRRGLPLLAVLAGVAPLFGLLGTVAGMIETFQSITLFGTGDPKLMSGGISEALVTTELGLAVAIPLVLSHGFLSSRSNRLVQVLDQQSAALVSRRVEQGD